MALLDSVKNSQRVTNSLVNLDFAQLIEACKKDLERLGLRKDFIEAEGAEVTQACKLWVHWFTDYEGKGDRWRDAYNGYVDGLRKTVANLEVEEAPDV